MYICRDKAKPFRRDRLRPNSIKKEALEGPPGGRFELRLDLFKQLAGNVRVVFVVPLPAQFAGGILTLIQYGLHLGLLRPALAAAPEGSQVIDRDVSQPVAKRARPAAVDEGRQLGHDHREHLLHQIIHIIGLRDVPAQPGANQGRVQVDEPFPVQRIAFVLQAL
jgi:hypothetical protein